MREVKRDFDRRILEINTYFQFLKKIDLNRSLIWEDDSDEIISPDLRKIMKAQMFIMLYNLAESSLSASIEKIHNSITLEETATFDNIKDGIKERIITNLKKNKNPKRFITEINDISNDIIEFCFDRKQIFSGNANRKQIKKIATHYGFSIDSDYDKTKHGEKLDTVKNHRNELAHGVFSFLEIGQDYTLQDIKEYKEEIIAYLEQIVKNIEKYIDEKKYLV